MRTTFLLSLATLTLGMSSSVLAEITLIKNRTSSAEIVLPATTELDRYVAASDAELEARIKARFPQADADLLARLLGQYREHRKKEAARVGDEELLAAEELQHYLEKISGVKLPIRRLAPQEPLPEQPSILLGAELARRAGHPLEGLGKDGIVLHAGERHLVLSGQRARGTLFAVYDFLESLGCRWFMPGPAGELVPSLPTVSTAVEKQENPSHSERYWWCTYGNGDEYPRWTLRNKGTFVRALGDQVIRQGHSLHLPLAWGATDPALGITQREPIRRPQLGPDRKPLLDADGKVIFETVEGDVKRLPDEYYALAGGKPAHHTPNMANPKVWDLYQRYFKYYFTERFPFDDYASISAEDGLVVDDRLETKLLDSNEYDPFMGAFSATDRLWFFHQRYIPEVNATLPGRKYSALVYSNNLTPPRMTKVHPDMALILAPLGISPLFHVRDPRSKSNRSYHQWLEAWMAQARAAQAETYYYDYEPIGFQWSKAMLSPRWQIIGKNYPYFHSLGLNGYTSQGFDDWGACGIDNWMMVRLFWNAQQDYREILRDYCERRFGKAGAAMLRYYTVYEERMNEIPELCSNESWGNHLALTPEVRKKARAALKEAREAASNEWETQQVALANAIQESTDAFCDGIEIARETADYGKGADRMKLAFEIAERLNREHYSHFMQPKSMSLETQTLYEPGGWYAKYRNWDRQIRESDSALALPRYWKMALDTDQLAETKGWHLPGADLSELEEWDVTVVPDIRYETQREVAAFFYQTEVEIPKSFSGQRATLYFPSLIARGMQIWIDGEPVTFDYGSYRDTVFRGPPTFWYNYDHQQRFDITPYLKPGQKQVIAFRVFKSFDHAGSYDRIFLLGHSAE